jgi:SMI1/KNR4 family protein SUKH-1
LTNQYALGEQRLPAAPLSSLDWPAADVGGCWYELRMNPEHADPEDLAAIRSALAIDDNGACALGWDAVRAFESQHRVVLPEPYRTFVAEISDGSRLGPPEYGLVGLAQLPNDWGKDRPVRDLSKPFPLTQAWFWGNDPRPQEEIGPILGKVFDHGSVVLGTDGCGMYWHLIVTGEHRGHVWLITGECAAPFGLESGDLTLAGEPGFAGWVKRWAAGEFWFDED